jgi:hypothetical protein
VLIWSSDANTECTQGRAPEGQRPHRTLEEDIWEPRDLEGLTVSCRKRTGALYLLG